MTDLNRMRKLAGILVESSTLSEKYDDAGFIKQAISMFHPEYMSYDDLKQRVAQETGYSKHPEYDSLFKQAYDSFYGLDMGFNDSDSDGNDDSDYTDYSMRQGELGNPDRMRESAPPGMEDTVLSLKKQYPGEEEKAFATAWSIYNKKHGKTDEAIELGDNTLGEPGWYIVSGAGAVNAGPYASEQAARSDTDRMRWFNQTDSILYGIEDEEGNFVDAETGDKHQFGRTVDEASKSGNRELWDKINSRGVVPGIDRERYTDLSSEGLEGPFRHKSGRVVYYDPKEGKYYDRDTDMYIDDMNEAFDLNNGYNDSEYIDASDYFPNGADGSVTSKTGPSGARHGDNPEQKAIAVKETHKELVYSYRKYLKESAYKVDQKTYKVEKSSKK